jgi:hypothetical protein
VNNQLLSVTAIASDDVWSVGLSAGNSSGPSTLIEHWNGTTWSAVPGAGSGAGALFGVDGVATAELWAVGDPGLLEHWNGAIWSVVAPAVPRGGSGLAFRGVDALGGNDAWAVGYYGVGGTVKTLAEHWNGSKWSVVPSPNAGRQVASRLYAVSARSSSDVWAVGFSGASGSERPLIEHWNGTAWSLAANPANGASPAYLLGVAARTSSEGLAVGRGSGPLIERWTGSSWRSDAIESLDGSLSGVVSLSASDAWASGIDRGSGPLIEHWDGNAWSVIAAPSVAPGANGLAALDALSAVDLWAVGDRGVAGGRLSTLIEHYVSSAC